MPELSATFQQLEIWTLPLSISNHDFKIKQPMCAGWSRNFVYDSIAQNEQETINKAKSMTRMGESKTMILLITQRPFTYNLAQYIEFQSLYFEMMIQTIYEELQRQMDWSFSWSRLAS